MRWVLVFLLPTVCAAQPIGRTHFLTHGPGTLEEALGGATVATSHGPNALYYNSAGLARGASGVTGELTKLLPGINYSWFGSAFSVGAHQLGFGIVNLDLGQIERRTTRMDPGSPASSYQRAYLLGLSKRLGNDLSLGLTLGYLDFRLADYDSRARLVDVGLTKRINSGLSAGAVLKNAYFSGLNFAGNKEIYPQELRLGMAQKLGAAALHVQMERVLDGSKPKFATGLSYSPINIVSFRAGLNGNPRFGFGLTTKSRLFSVDFSWQMRALSPTSRVGLSYWFRDRGVERNRRTDPYQELQSRARALANYYRETAKRLLEDGDASWSVAAYIKLLALNPSDKQARTALAAIAGGRDQYPKISRFRLSLGGKEKIKKRAYLRWSVSFASDSYSESEDLAKDFIRRWPQDRRALLIRKLMPYLPSATNAPAPVNNK